MSYMTKELENEIKEVLRRNFISLLKDEKFFQFLDKTFEYYKIRHLKLSPSNIFYKHRERCEDFYKQDKINILETYSYIKVDEMLYYDREQYEDAKKIAVKKLYSRKAKERKMDKTDKIETIHKLDDMKRQYFYMYGYIERTSQALEEASHIADGILNKIVELEEEVKAK